MSLDLSEIFADLAAETNRLGTQGSMELANALFNGTGFVPYGPGQYMPSPEVPQEQAQAPEQMQPDRYGRDL